MAIIGKFENKSRKPRLTGGQLAEILDLFRYADSVEFKLTVPDSDRHSAIRSLELDVLDAGLQQVFFFDTRNLKLSRAGIVLRARRMRKGGDSIVKLRPLNPTDISGKLRRSSSFNIEIDAMPGAYVCSGSLKSKADNSEIQDASMGRHPIRKLFSSEQRSLYKEHAPKGLDLDEVVALGPINVAKLKFAPRALKNRIMAAELWFYPDGSRILELSTRCTTDQTIQVLAETRSFLTDRGIRITDEQETKTHRALDYFSHLKGERNSVAHLR
jgi:hypothetical protein